MKRNNKKKIGLNRETLKDLSLKGAVGGAKVSQCDNNSCQLSNTYCASDCPSRCLTCIQTCPASCVVSCGCGPTIIK